jgi:hypothetical protein
VRSRTAKCLIAILGSGPHQAGGPLAHAAIREAELRDAAVDAQRSPVPLSWTVDRGLAAATRLMDLSQGRQDPPLTSPSGDDDARGSSRCFLVRVAHSRRWLPGRGTPVASLFAWLAVADVGILRDSRSRARHARIRFHAAGS